MFIKKLKSIIISGVMSLALIAGLLAASAPMRAAAQTSSANIPTQGLVGYWTFDGNYNDSASGLTTTKGGKDLNYIDGIYGKAVELNGKSDYLYVDADPVLNLGNSYTENNDNLTISAWVNLGDSASGAKYLLDKGLASEWTKGDGFNWSNPYAVYFETCEPTVYLSNIFNDQNVEPNVITEGSTFLSGKYVDGEEWFLLTVTYDGKRIKIYRDNELLNQTNYTDGITYNNEELYIGVDHTLEHYFKGAIDDLRIYNIAFTYENVEALYQAGLEANKELVEPTKQLVAYYPFDESLKDESAFKNDAEVVTGGKTKYEIGMNGKAIIMSKGNYILVPAADQLNFDTEFSVSLWLKLNSTTDKEYPVLYRLNPSYAEDNDNDDSYSMYAGTWGNAENTRMYMGTYVYDPDSWSPQLGQSLTSDFYYEENKVKSTDWFHYTYTYKDGQMKSYLNGVLLHKTDASDLINIANASGDLLIGYDNETFLNGTIDELKIFNSCLNDAEVKTEAKRVDTISLSKANSDKLAALGKGKTITISSILLNDVDKGKAVTIDLSNKNFTFKSSNSKIFKVTSDGKITGVKAGKAKLTITYGCHSVTYNVTVK